MRYVPYGMRGSLVYFVSRSKVALQPIRVQKKLEITFQCKDGVQLCSRQILGQSDYFYLQANARTNFGNPLTFNYPDYSQDTIKFFLDCMYCIKLGCRCYLRCTVLLITRGHPLESLSQSI